MHKTSGQVRTPNGKTRKHFDLEMRILLLTEWTVSRATTHPGRRRKIVSTTFGGGVVSQGVPDGVVFELDAGFLRRGSEGQALWDGQFVIECGDQQLSVLRWARFGLLW